MPSDRAEVLLIERNPLGALSASRLGALYEYRDEEIIDPLSTAVKMIYRFTMVADCAHALGECQNVLLIGSSLPRWPARQTIIKLINGRLESDVLCFSPFSNSYFSSGSKN